MAPTQQEKGARGGKGPAAPDEKNVTQADAPKPGEGAAEAVAAQADAKAQADEQAPQNEQVAAEAARTAPGDVPDDAAKSVSDGGDARKDLVVGLPTPVNSQFGTHKGVTAEAEAVRQQNSPADLAGGSYATTALAAPLTPSDQVSQVVPALGDPRTSTNPVAANASHQPIAGEQHLSLVGEDGQDIGPDALFTDPGGDTTFVIAAQRTYERFNYPNVTDASTRLLYPAGARVPKAQAASIIATLRRQAAFQS